MPNSEQEVGEEGGSSTIDSNNHEDSPEEGQEGEIPPYLREEPPEGTQQTAAHLCPELDDDDVSVFPVDFSVQLVSTKGRQLCMARYSSCLALVPGGKKIMCVTLSSWHRVQKEKGQGTDTDRMG